jgi:Activator of Hsp90 ATPase homolog 1-like protein
MAADPHDPITLELRLACTPEHAFAVYTERIGEWWDGRYTANAETLEDVIIGPHVGGRVYATHSDLGRHDWGEVTVWDPGRRLTHSFTLAQDAGHPSEVRVDFAPDGGGCAVSFAHGGWTPDNAAHRQKFGDWAILLERFAVLAQAPAARDEQRSA